MINDAHSVHQFIRISAFSGALYGWQLANYLTKMQRYVLKLINQHALCLEDVAPGRLWRRRRRAD